MSEGYQRIGVSGDGYQDKRASGKFFTDNQISRNTQYAIRNTIKIPTIGYEIVNAILSTSADNILWMGRIYPVRYYAIPRYADDDLRHDNAFSRF